MAQTLRPRDLSKIKAFMYAKNKESLEIGRL